MIVQNHKEVLDPDTILTPTVLENMRQWKKAVFRDSYPEVQRFIMLFNQYNISITWRLFILGVLSSLMGAGVLFLLPMMFEIENMGLWEYFLTTLMELPAIMVLLLVIDFEKLGRVFLINISLLVSALLYLAIFYFRD